MMVTKNDMELLRALVEIHSFGRDADDAARLGSKLACASVVTSEQVPLDVVTMNSRVLFEDETGTRREVLLAYPPAVDGSRDRVSVLSSVGRALLGCTVGESIDRPITEGSTRRLRIVAVPYQPESVERAAAAQVREGSWLASGVS